LGYEGLKIELRRMEIEHIELSLEEQKISLSRLANYYTQLRTPGFEWTFDIKKVLDEKFETERNVSEWAKALSILKEGRSCACKDCKGWGKVYARDVRTVPIRCFEEHA
jgi:hypothetical protein